jgi:hypothetical protein
MSQRGGQGTRARAIFAILCVCALVFGLLVSGSPHASAHSGLRGAASGVGAFCHDRDTSAASVEGVTQDKNGAKKRGHCPCCLAANAGPAAVLPERFALLMRLAPSPRPAVYCSLAEILPRFALRQAVNGARAPPPAATFA